MTSNRVEIPSRPEGASTPTDEQARTKRRASAVVAGAVGALALAASMSGTLSALTTSITNSANSGGLGSLTMVETGTAVDGVTQITCETTATASAITCTDINKYGGNLAMSTGGAGATNTENITIQNSGTTDASAFTLTAGACTLANPAATTGNLCDSALVTVIQDGTTVISGVTPTALAANGAYALAPVAAGATSNIQVVFDVSGLDNTVQGQSVSQPLTWTFNA